MAMAISSDIEQFIDVLVDYFSEHFRIFHDCFVESQAHLDHVAVGNNAKGSTLRPSKWHQEACPSQLLPNNHRILARARHIAETKRDFLCTYIIEHWKQHPSRHHGLQTGAGLPCKG